MGDESRFAMEKTFKVTNSTADESSKNCPRTRTRTRSRKRKRTRKRKRKRKRTRTRTRTRKRRVHRILNYKYAMIIFQDALFSPGLSTQRETIRMHYIVLDLIFMNVFFLIINLIGSRIVSTIVPT